MSISWQSLLILLTAVLWNPHDFIRLVMQVAFREKKDRGIPCVHMQRNLKNQPHGWHPVMSVMSKVIWLRRLCSLIKLVIFPVISPWEILVMQFRDVASYLMLTWKISFPSPMGWAVTLNELCPPTMHHVTPLLIERGDLIQLLKHG